MVTDVYFRNSMNWKKVYLILFSKANHTEEIVELVDKDMDGDYVVQFDSDKYTYLYFAESEDKESRTSIIYVGNVSIGIEYKYDEINNRNSTCFFCKDGNSTGHIETYVIEDKENLQYRKDNSKKINIFVPCSYNENVPCGVLYFFDSQNLFTNAGVYTDKNDAYGGWQLDIVLDNICRQYGKNMIVVGIDNSDEYRAQELFMPTKKFGKLSPFAKLMPEDAVNNGKLDGLATFICNTLHPFIREKYNVDNSNVGIGGSSMGGIAALYCAIKDIDFYKYSISYSGAYALYEEDAYENFFVTKKFTNCKDKLPKIHIYCGNGDELDSGLMFAVKRMKNTLVKCGYDKEKIFETFDEWKAHNEEAWRLVLPESFTKLLGLNKNSI